MTDNVTDVFGSWLPALAALAAQQGQQGTTGAKQPRENSSADGLPSKRAKPTRRGGRGRGQSLPQEQSGNVVTMLASLCLQQEDALNRIRLETSHTLHLAASTTRAGSRTQGAVQRRHRVASQEEQRGASTGPQSGPLWVAFGRNSGQDPTVLQRRRSSEGSPNQSCSGQRQEICLPEMGRTGQQIGNRPGQEGADTGGSDGHPDGATQAQQRPDHHQVQRESAPQEGTGQRRKGGIHCGSSNALATRQSHSGPPRSDDRQRGMGFGSRAVETTQSQAPRASQCHPEGPGGRLDGPIHSSWLLAGLLPLCWPLGDARASRQSTPPEQPARASRQSTPPEHPARAPRFAQSLSLLCAKKSSRTGFARARR